MKVQCHISLLISAVLWISCQHSETHPNSPVQTTLTLPRLCSVETHFPIILSKVNLQSDISRDLPDVVKTKVTDIVVNYYFDFGGDSSQIYFTPADVYVGTICASIDTLHDLYVLLLNAPAGPLNSKVFLYNRIRNKTSESVIDYNIHALYTRENNKLLISNLKELFRMPSPDIELLNREQDNIPKLKFTRLYHNGTTNAIEIASMKVNGVELDTLDFKRSFLEK
ncbi:hypothetical protein [Xanthocytophaga agilis]|uniref:hypothetical protein n=1 Tax=Xanthocytophaga agilis TaxID=3048010 RepID=UPI0028D209AC|nr:hypothetical protein [Xanthocytophaga agilis]